MLTGSRSARRSALLASITGTARQAIVEELGRRRLDHGSPASEWQVALPEQPRALPTVDIAVCTRDRAHALRATLDTLVAAKDSGTNILVIDNAPSNDTTRLVAAQYGSRIQYLLEPAPGLDHARNCALYHARGDILAFVDDDVIVDPTWLAAVRGAFANPDLSMLTGLVEPLTLDSEAARTFEAFGGFGRGYLRQWFLAPSRRAIAFRWANTGRWGTGANMAFRREALLAVGAFDPALDAGTLSAGGGDLEIMFRILKAGGLQHYAPHAMVRHAHRSSMQELESQLESWGSGMSAQMASIRHAFPEERVALMLMDMWRYSLRYLRRLATTSLTRSVPPHLAWAELRGSLHGRSRYIAGGGGQSVRPWARLDRTCTGTTDIGTVDFADMADSINAGDACQLVVQTALAGQPLHRVTVPSANKCVSRDRLRDVVIRANPSAALGESAATAVARIAAAIATAR